MKSNQNKCPCTLPYAVLAWSVIAQSERDVANKSVNHSHKVSAMKFLQTENTVKRLCVDIIGYDIDRNRVSNTVKKI